MSAEALNITGKRQLMLDPRIVAEQHNVMKCMSQARKIGRVINLDPKLQETWRLQYATVTWDDRLKKVRLYYSLYGGKNCYHGLAESSDGEHFQTWPEDTEQVLDETVTGRVRITKDFADCDRMLDPLRIDGPIRMNGKLDDPQWKKAPATTNFMKTNADDVSAFGTEVRVLYDDLAVYVGFDCPGERIWDEKLASANVTEVEQLEVIIDPTCSREDSYYFSVGCYGQKSQDGPASKTEDGWQDDWEFSIDRRADGWSAIVKIPFSVLELPKGKPGCAWGFNVCHNIPAASKDAYTRYTNWAGCGPHRSPEKLGVLVFDEDEFRVKHQPVWEDVTTGRAPSTHYGDLCVFVDPNGPDQERYKMTWRDGGYLYVAVSPDGLNFRTIKSILDTGNLDSMNLCMWDPISKKYLIYTRWWFREGTFPAQRRGAARTESPTWTGPWPERQTVMDPCDFPGNEEGYRDFYTPGVFVYENLYLALPSVYLRNIEWGPLAPSLLASPDGINWEWLGDGLPFIERSPGQWDCARVYALAPPILIGDKLYFYYTGQSTQHHVRKKVPGAQSGIGAAWIHRDRFLCYHGYSRWPGYVITEPLIFEKGSQLRVNAEESSEDGQLRVEVVGDERFTAEKCRPISGDHLDAPVEWEGANLADLMGKPFRLKFHLPGARLYGFEVV